MSEPTTRSKGSPTRLSPDVRDRLARCRDVFRETAELRVNFPRFEDPIRRIEENFRAHPPKKGRFRKVLEETVRLVRATEKTHAEVHEKEKAALDRLREVRQEVLAVQRAGGPDLTDLSEALSEWVRLRGVEVEWLDGVLQHSHMIVNLSPQDGTPVQLYTLLQQRRTYMEQVNSMLGDAELAERRLAVEAADSGKGTSGREPGRDKLIRDRKWDEWLGKVQEGDREKPREGNGKEAALETKPAEDEKAADISAPFQRLTRLVDALKESISAAETDTRKIVADDIAGIEAAHGKTLAERDAAAKKLDATVQRLTDERDESRAARKEAQRQLEETRTKLGRVETTLASEKKAHADAKAKAEADAKKAADRIAELEGEAKAAADQIETLKKVRDETKKAHADLEAKVKAEREELAKQKKKAEEEVESANQERDEALVLISSLTKRLGTPGVEDGKKK
jgi:chromosome segregation ATPase